jgi:hypothetical protein
VPDERTKDDDTVYNAYGNAEGEVTLCAGDRAPDAPGLQAVELQKQASTTLALSDIFGVTHHVILAFGADAVTPALAAVKVVKRLPAGVARVVACLPRNSDADIMKNAEPGETVMVVKDGEGHAHANYLLTSQESGIFVVRPDGAIIDSVDGLERYLKLVFV